MNPIKMTKNAFILVILTILITFSISVVAEPQSPWQNWVKQQIKLLWGAIQEIQTILIDLQNQIDNLNFSLDKTRVYTNSEIQTIGGFSTGSIYCNQPEDVALSASCYAIPQCQGCDPPSYEYGFDQVGWSDVNAVAGITCKNPFSGPGQFKLTINCYKVN